MLWTLIPCHRRVACNSCCVAQVGYIRCTILEWSCHPATLRAMQEELQVQDCVCAIAVAFRLTVMSHGARPAFRRLPPRSCTNMNVICCSCAFVNRHLWTSRLVVLKGGRVAQHLRAQEKVAPARVPCSAAVLGGPAVRDRLVEGRPGHTPAVGTVACEGWRC